MASNAFERFQRQKGEKRLAAHQEAIRLQMRIDGERQSSRLSAKEKEAIKIKIDEERSKQPALIWREKHKATLNGVPITSLPKTRDFWKEVDFSKMSTGQLRATVTLLDLETCTGNERKHIIVSHLQNWVDLPNFEKRMAVQTTATNAAEALEASGSVFSFGCNDAGQLGTANTTSESSAVEVMALKGKRITKVVTGFEADFAFAISAEGVVYSWGGGGNAPLGFPVDAPLPLHLIKETESSFLTPRVIPNLRSRHVTDLTCSRRSGHLAVVTEGGECYTWGQGDYGQLGIQKKTNTIEHVSAAEPTYVSLLSDSIISSVSVGNSHTVILTDAGRVFAWGACWGGQLGLGYTSRPGAPDSRLALCCPKPALVTGPLEKIRVQQVSCGAVHTAVITAKGQLFTFGCNDGGRLGLGHTTDMCSPTLVPSLESSRTLKVCCSNWHTLCIVAASAKTKVSAGWLYSFGNGINGQLGLGKSQTSSFIPIKIPALADLKMKVTSVHASSYHCAAVAEDGSVFSWGRNTSGCLGRHSVDGSEGACTPGIVDNIKGWGRGKAISVACGSSFTLVLTAPYRGISKSSYNDIDTLNKKKKPVEKFIKRQEVVLPSTSITNNNNNLSESSFRPRRCTVARTCPGFSLDTNGPRNTYTCEHCKLPRRLHDL